MSYTTEVLADSPVGAWMLQGDADALEGSNGTPSNVTFGSANGPAPQLPDAAVFNGSNSVINVGNQSPDTGPEQPWTYEAWVYFDAVGSTRYRFLAQVTSGTSQAPRLSHADNDMSDGDAGCEYRANQGSSRQSVAFPASAETWYHLVAVHTGHEMRLYVNGELEDTNSHSSSHQQTNDLLIGSDSSFPLAGRLAGVAVYDTALSASRVEAHYDAAFEDNGGPAVRDVSSHGSTGSSTAGRSGSGSRLASSHSGTGSSSASVKEGGLGGLFTGMPANANTASAYIKPHKPVFYHAGSWWALVVPDTDSEFFVMRRNLAGDWSKASPVVTTQNPTRLDAHLRGDSLYWYKRHATNFRVGRLDYNSGTGTWDIVVNDVLVPELGDSTRASLAVDSSGRMFCFGDDQDGGLIEYIVRDGSDGSEIQDVTTLTTSPPAELEFLSRSVAWDGKIGVIWDDQDGEEIRFVWRNDSDGVTTWQTEEIVASGSSIADDHCDITPGPDGDLLAVWKTSLGGSEADNIMFARRTGVDSWTAPEVVWSRFGGTSQEYTRPRVAYDATNDEVIVVATNQDGHTEIVARRSPRLGVSFGPNELVFDISGEDPDSINDPTVPHHSVTAESGLLVLAPTNGPRQIWESLLAIESGAEPDERTASSHGGAGSSTAGRSGAGSRLASSRSGAASSTAGRTGSGSRLASSHSGTASSAARVSGAVSGPFLHDTFTDDDETSLADHTPDVGGAWVAMGFGIGGAGAPNALHVNNNRLEIETLDGNQAPVHRNAADPGADEYDIEATMSFRVVTGSNDYWGISFRMSAAGTLHADVDRYIALFRNDTEALELYRVVSGSLTLIDSESIDLAGETLSVRIEVRDGAQLIYVDNDLVLSATDANITQRGRVGVGGGRHGAGKWLDDLTATPAGVAPAPAERTATSHGGAGSSAASRSGTGSRLASSHSGTAASAARVSGAATRTASSHGGAAASAAGRAGTGSRLASSHSDTAASMAGRTGSGVRVARSHGRAGVSSAGVSFEPETSRTVSSHGGTGSSAASRTGTGSRLANSLSARGWTAADRTGSGSRLASSHGRAGSSAADWSAAERRLASSHGRTAVSAAARTGQGARLAASHGRTAASHTARQGGGLRRVSSHGRAGSSSARVLDHALIAVPVVTATGRHDLAAAAAGAYDLAVAAGAYDLVATARGRI